MTSADEFLLQLLIDKKIVDEALVKSTRAQAKKSPQKSSIDSVAIELLLKSEVVTQNQIAQTLADEFNLERVNLSNFQVSKASLEVLPFKLADRYKVFPLKVNEKEMELAIFDPLNMDATDTIGHMLHRSVVSRVATLKEIEHAIETHYTEGAPTVPEETPRDEGASNENPEEGNLEFIGVDTGNGSEEEAPIMRYVHRVISAALQRNASDIHMEPLEKRFRVRYRVDGVLHEVENPPKRLQRSIISRIKLMANISIAEKRLPQDGRIQY